MGRVGSGGAGCDDSLSTQEAHVCVMIARSRINIWHEDTHSRAQHSVARSYLSPHQSIIHRSHHRRIDQAIGHRHTRHVTYVTLSCGEEKRTGVERLHSLEPELELWSSGCPSRHLQEASPHRICTGAGTRRQSRRDLRAATNTCTPSSSSRTTTIDSRGAAAPIGNRFRVAAMTRVRRTRAFMFVRQSKPLVEVSTSPIALACK